MKKAAVLGESPRLDRGAHRELGLNSWTPRSSRGDSLLFKLLLSLLLISTAHAKSHLPDGFVYLSQIDPSILQEMRYFTSHNFVGRPVRGYRAGVCILTHKAAVALSQAQQHFLKRGVTLKVYDCYRPQRAVQDFVEWSRDDTLTTKAEFYPDMNKDVLFPDYIAYYSGHTRGSTVDLTLVKLPVTSSADYHPGDPLTSCTAPTEQRLADNTIDMGTGFDCFSPIANTLHRPLPKIAQKNRALLHHVMHRAGFVNYPNEWWHYSLRQERFKNRYFDFPVQ